jgi:hypothetical protein
MFRILLALLTSVAVLVCPFVCAGALSDPCAGESVVQPSDGCACCGDQLPTPDHQDRPTVPRDDNCCDCVCKGVLESQQKACQELLQTRVGPEDCVVSEPRVAAGDVTSAFFGAGPFLQPRSGIVLRLILCSLLR